MAIAISPLQKLLYVPLSLDFWAVFGIRLSLRIHSIGTKETVSSGVILDVSTFPSSRATYLRAIVSQCEGILPHPRIPLSFISAKPFAGVISLTVLPKQVVEFLHQGVFMLLDALGDLVGRLDLLVLIEGAGEGDLVAHLGLALVDPGIRIIPSRQHLLSW